MAGCKRTAASRVYTLKFLPARSVTVRLDAVGYRRSTKEQKGKREEEKEEEKEKEASGAQTEEEEKDPNIRVPSYKQGG